MGKKGIQMTRFKGLGEMDAKELFETTMNPVKRKLLRIDLSDAVEAEEMFVTLMGEEVEPRRNFIVDNALNVPQPRHLIRPNNFQNLAPCQTKLNPPPPPPHRNNNPAAAPTRMGEKISKINVADEIKNSFLDYSMSVIISRALPDVRDGLKPSQRRILYAMHELHYSPDASLTNARKSAATPPGNYHPHGEAVIYPTLVHMAQPWAMREKLVDGKGNFGSVENDPPAAMRYTEARLTHLGAALMQDMEKDTVDFVPNYDERLTEPRVFPAAFPNLLVNGRHRHRGRHGHEHGAPQSRRSRGRHLCADRQAGNHDSGVDEVHQGARISRPADSFAVSRASKIISPLARAASSCADASAWKR